MINDPSRIQLRASENALTVLEHFSVAAGVAFDRIVASRVLVETEQSVSGLDGSAWSRRLVQVGESINLRIRSVDCRFSESLAFVRHGVPVAICLSEDSEDPQRQNGDGSHAERPGADKTDETPHWVIIAEVNGSRFRVIQLGVEQTEQWMSTRQLRKLLAIQSPNEMGRWLIGQAALWCETPASEDKGKPAKPLTRLLGLLRPEKKDLWVVVVFSIIVGFLALATPVAVEALVNTVAFGQYLQPVVILALMLFTFLAFASAIRALLTFVVEIFQRRLFIRVVEDLAYRLPRVQQAQFDGTHGPEAVNRFMDIVTVQKTASTLLLDGISIVLQTAIGMAVLAFYHPFLLGFDAVLLALIALAVFGLGRGAISTAIKESKAKYAIAAWLEELARHPTAFKLHSGSQFALERADQLAMTWLNKRQAHFRVVIRQILFALGLQAVAATALLGLGGWLVILGELTLGQLVAAELIVMMIVGSFAKLGKHMESFYDLLASVDKLGQLFDLRIEPNDKLFHLREGEPAHVRVHEASYKYAFGGGGLSKCDLELTAGESVALVGVAGSGKSTLVDLIAGVRSPNAGHIELDGIDVRELRPDSLRDHLAISRSIEVFAGSINENVHLNRTNVRASDVRDALETVGLLDELLSLPEGLNTELQTNGFPLTHSQSLRLMIARAIVGRPRLLLIDGTLDALPDGSLEQVAAGLIGSGHPWTLLIATGRREVAEMCDRKVVLGDVDSLQPQTK